MLGFGNEPPKINLSVSSIQGAADILGLSVTTVKSHLQHIFAKTGTNKQSDLIQLLMRASAPII
jgi:DNA-binding NarL/FixJ family response regulator